MVLLKFLLPIFFIIYSFAELLRLQLFKSVSIGFIDVVVAAVVISWIIFVKKSSYYLKFPILIFLLMCILSQIYNLGNFDNSQLKVGVLYLFRWILYACLYFVFADVGKKYQKIITNYMLTSGIFIVIFGFIQYLYYPSLKNLIYQGWDDHLYRLFSSFLDPNFAGVFIVLFIIFVFIIKQKNSLNKRNIYFLNLLLIASLSALILTYSRGAILMLIMSAFIYCVLKRNYKVVAVLIGGLIIVTILLSPNFSTVNTDLFRTPSLDQRIENTKQTLVVYKKNPVFGVGFNNFRYARERYIQKDWLPYASHAGAGSDNSLALILATTGIPGLVAYLFLLYKILKLGVVNLKKNPFAWILVLSLTGLIFNSFLLNSLLYSFIMIWIWILAGLTESNSRG